MSRAGYSEDYDDNWSFIMWRGAVTSALKGKRGQAFLREMLDALNALPEPRLVAGELEDGGSVCALGAVGKARGIEMKGIDPDDYSTVAGKFGVAQALAREIVFENDEGSWRSETPEQRFDRMKRWVEANLRPPAESLTDPTQ